MIEFLIALALYATDTYDGQADPWYARGCLARRYLLVWYQIRDPHDWINSSCIERSYRRRARAIYWRLARCYANQSLYRSMRASYTCERANSLISEAAVIGF